MANHSATRKSIRKTETRNARNRYQGKTARNSIRDFRELESKSDAEAAFSKLVSQIDKLKKNGLIHKNKAANLKSKLQKKIATLN